MERPRVKLNAQIYDEASAWFVQCRAGDLDESDRRELDRWLRKSPEHVSAYLEIAAIWSEGPSLDPTRKWDIDTLLAEAPADRDNVISLPVTQDVARALVKESASEFRQGRSSGKGHTAGSADPEPESDLVGATALPVRADDHLHLRLSKRRLLAIAASLAGLAVGGGGWTWFQLSAPLYATAVGEQRSIELADGSTVSMNSKSKIRVRYSKTERLVDLLEGQALFHVAKDSTHPFIVSACGTRVQAVGTQFDVYERRVGTTVTVLEGRVAVLPPPQRNSLQAPDLISYSDSPRSSVSASAAHTPSSSDGVTPGTAPWAADTTAGDSSLSPATPILVSAGEQITVTRKAADKIEHANITAATAWRDRQIVFESATLSEVAEEFNRYNERHVVIDHPELLTFHVSGVFSATDPESLISFLRARPGVKVTEEGATIHVAKNS